MLTRAATAVFSATQLCSPVYGFGGGMNVVCTGDELELDVEKALLHNRTTKETYELKPLGEVEPILEAGGLFPYAKTVGMLKA